MAVLVKFGKQCLLGRVQDYLYLFPIDLVISERLVQDVGHICHGSWEKAEELNQSSC